MNEFMNERASFPKKPSGQRAAEWQKGVFFFPQPLRQSDLLWGLTHEAD